MGDKSNSPSLDWIHVQFTLEEDGSILEKKKPTVAHLKKQLRRSTIP